MSFRRVVILFATFCLGSFFLAAGCDRAQPDSACADIDVPSDASDRSFCSTPAFTSEELSAQQMRGFLDEGEESKALALARGLMVSTNSDVRAEVVLVLGWIGRRAMPELEEMFFDSDEKIAHEALIAWEQANDSVHFDGVRALNIERAITNLTDVAAIDAILMQYSSMDEKVAETSLRKIISSSRGKIVSNRAKEMYEHVTGEFWSE